VDHVPLDLLRTFQAVHRLGSMTGAAAVLHVSQPTVTSQVRALERLVGRPLFVRGARGVTPTAAGRDLAERIEAPLDALVAVAAGLTAAGDLAGRTLHLGGPADLLSVLVVPALAEVLAAGVDVRVRVGLADDLLGELAAGRLDLVVSTVRPRRGVDAVPLLDEEFALVAAPALAATLDPVAVAADPARALAAVPLLAWSDDLAVVRRWWRHVLGRPPATRPLLVLPDLRGLLAAAEAGLGATVLPHYLHAGSRAGGRLVSLHPTPDPPINTLYLAGRAATRQQPHVALARQVLLERARHW
jgi:DNA-binding transcriptional LysR family regulator